ncbi:MAG: division/cell wall cluster transcriptional repressor MraZ [Lachnospiraceae bacterium]|nr:division/cell wall cluster transcriptional repressor MraZ [Lachnospiraceae bacterium]MCR5087456.1 division/cell wall cluster transcriptional repressor MraZ [Lachnospiraceae bacterium]
MLNYFNGKQIHSVDAKGRVIVPVKFREKLGEQFIVALGIDCCLNIYPMDEWLKLLEKLDTNLPGTDGGRKLLTFLSANSEPVEMDKQGRVILPQELRERVGITKDIVSVGALDKIKMFSKEAWDQYNDSVSREEIASTAATYGIRL